MSSAACGKVDQALIPGNASPSILPRESEFGGPIAVLDSSVLVPRWSRLVLQRLAQRPDEPYVPVWSEWIIAETWRVLAWQWIVRAGETDQEQWRLLTRAANEMLRYLLPVLRSARYVPIPVRMLGPR